MTLIQKSVWNSLSNEKEFTSKLDYDDFVNSINKSSAILDYGCGYGRTLKDLESLGYDNLFGTEISTEMLKRAKTNLKSTKLSLMENQRTNLEDSSIDCLLLLGILTCAVYDNLIDEIFTEIYRVLKTNGVIYFTDFLLNTDERNFKRYEEYTSLGIYGAFKQDKLILRHFENNYLLNKFKEYNIEILEFPILTTMNGNKGNSIYLKAVKY
jgi:SAM-dependent methyltransferase